MAWWLTWWAGGTHTVAPHLFYFPVVLSAVFLPASATLAVCVAAGLAAGPLMPLDVDAGLAQPTVNWAVRAAFSLAVGLATHLSVGWRQRSLFDAHADMTRKRAEIVQIISHEFLTPLTIITPARQMLDRENLTPEQGRQVRHALGRATVRIEELVKVMVAAGEELGADGRKPTEAVDITEILDQVVDSLPEVDAQRRVEILVGEGAEHLATVRPYLRLMLRSLVENALKYSPADAPVHVEVQRRLDAVRFRIIDQGPGIPAALVEHAQQAFNQVDSSTLRDKGGIGMGLYATARLAERLSGDLEFQHPEEGGFAVALKLPQRRDLEREPATTRTARLDV